MKSHGKWWKNIFSVCASTYSCQPQETHFFPFFSQSFLGFVRKNLWAVFALGFHHYPPLLLWLTGPLKSGGLASATFQWAPRIAGTASAYIFICCVLSHGLTKSPVPCALTVHRDFWETVLFRFYLLAYCSALVPYFGTVQMGLPEWHHAKNHSSVAGPLFLSQAMWIDSSSSPYFFWNAVF